MKQLSRTVVFVDTNPKSNRIGVLKDSNAISQLDDDDINVFQKSLIDRYEHRPNTSDQMCLAEFAANYRGMLQVINVKKMMMYYPMMKV